jgi:chromosome partitioning protein
MCRPHGYAGTRNHMKIETEDGRARIVALGNEKGGSGKSTTAMHLIMGLTAAGNRVATLDLDVRQGSLTRYLQNRRDYVARTGTELAIPETIPIVDGDLEGFQAALADLAARHDYVVLDCPGSDTPLSRMAHDACDALITPLNDSFVDFDVLAIVDPETYQVRQPSHYAEMVWESRKRRAMQRRPPLDWIVMRNRLSAVDAHNKQHLGLAIDELAKRIGFRLAPGFGERVIFRELFPQGLTLLDLGEKTGSALRLSHVAARQEVRSLLAALDLPSAKRRTAASVGLTTA